MKKRTMRIAAAGAIVAVAGFAGFWAFSQSTAEPARPAVLEALPQPVTHELAAIQPGEVILGDEKAPVTIIEYASLSCPHCASFHSTILPGLKAGYLDTGKAKLVLRDFPLNKPAVEGALLARCVSPMSYWAVVDLLFANQQQWVREDSLDQLSALAATAGVSTGDFTACQQDTATKDAILAGMQQGEAVFGVNSTPTFVINGIVLKEDNSLEAITRVIDALSPAS